jgi:hypothetical protein
MPATAAPVFVRKVRLEELIASPALMNAAFGNTRVPQLQTIVQASTDGKQRKTSVVVPEDLTF